MGGQNNTETSAATVVRALALELAFAEPGKDTGLLPINNFLMQLEELLPGQSPPVEVANALQRARVCIDRVFDSTATFEVDSIAWLAEWHHWMSTALDRWEQQLPIPAIPANWQTPPAVESKPTQAAPSAAGGGAPAAEQALALNLDSDRELLLEFVNESQEHLQNIEQGVLVLEDNPTDAATLNSIFRAFHTFKGGSGFLNLTPIKNLAHELESLLDAARQHKLTLNSGIIDVILEGGDTLKQFVSQITAQLNGSNDTEPMQIPTLSLIQKVQAILANPNAPVAAAPEPTVATSPTTPAVCPAVTKDEQSASAALSAAPANAITKAQTATNVAAGFVKVDTQKLDSLIDLVGELVITESMVVQDPDLRNAPSRHLARNLGQLRRITSELQRTAMSLRMVPIRATFQKMTRLVRDLAAKQQKHVQLVLNGEDTELDRNVVEEISDPLIHMIRNAADHGVEKPEARVAKGKPALGTINLRAFHRGGNIVIQIQDDGNGLNKEKLLAKACEKGIVKPGHSLSDKEIYDLIFAPGFSTAEQVTEISGRGVGMDVVRRNIEKLRGKVDIETTPGRGTTFTIYLPLTLAIIDGMIVASVASVTSSPYLWCSERPGPSRRCSRRCTSAARW
ncbi:MAG: chemotaxis protein CheA [Verrucomicrobiota bacterium]